MLLRNVVASGQAAQRPGVPTIKDGVAGIGGQYVARPLIWWNGGLARGSAPKELHSRHTGDQVGWALALTTLLPG